MLRLLRFAAARWLRPLSAGPRCAAPSCAGPRWVGPICLVLLAATADGATLRWASRGDAASMDPFAFNESLTSNIDALVYDTLVDRDRQGMLVPALAGSWTVVDDTTWRFNLRHGVKFQDGTPLTATDVVYSIERAQQPTSQIAQYARRLGKPTALDASTVELRLDSPNPVLLDHLATVFIMSRAWCIAHHAERVPDFKAHEEAYSTRNAMGSGPFVLVQREPGVRTVLRRNPDWWRGFDGNVTELIFTPVVSDATRTAALLAGDIDFIHEAPPQDVARLAQDPAVLLTRGPESRVIFLGFDQFRDQLVYAAGSDGKPLAHNPFKDPRVREAFYRAIDVEALKAKVMRGQSQPTGCMSPAAAGCLAPALEPHPPADVVRARQLLADAGYGGGFALTLDCPNDRYVNDQDLCVAIGSMLARIGVTLTVEARPKAIYFPKIQSHDTSFYLLGWGGGSTDAQFIMDPVLRSFDPQTQKGGDNDGRYSDPELDHLIDAASREMKPALRASLIGAALQRVAERFYYLPLHRQMLTWASRASVHPVIVPTNEVRVDWIRIE